MFHFQVMTDNYRQEQVVQPSFFTEEYLDPYPTARSSKSALAQSGRAAAESPSVERTVATRTPHSSSRVASPDSLRVRP